MFSHEKLSVQLRSPAFDFRTVFADCKLSFFYQEIFHENFW